MRFKEKIIKVENGVMSDHWQEHRVLMDDWEVTMDSWGVFQLAWGWGKRGFTEACDLRDIDPDSIMVEPEDKTQSVLNFQNMVRRAS